MDFIIFLPYLVACALVTYLVRMHPMVLVRKKIETRFVLSILHYVPNSVLTVMTIPDIFYASSDPVCAAVGFGVALVLAFFDRGLMQVAAISCGAVLAAELLLPHILF